MEAGFDSTAQHLVRDFQMRQFKQKQPAEAFAVDNPLPARMVMGITPGMDVIVCTTQYADVLSTVSKRAREDGLKVCYLASMEKGTNPNLGAHINNLGLLITGRSVAVQEHGGFNSMMQAESVVLLDPAEFGKLQLESGDKIRYRSNGTDAGFTKLDQTGELKYRIRELLNQ